MIVEEFLATMHNVKDKEDKWAFNCLCKGKDTKGKGVLYKNNLKYWYCSHDMNTGQLTGIEIKNHAYEFQERKEQYYQNHGLSTEQLIQSGLIDKHLNAIIVPGKMKKLVDNSKGKLRFSTKGIFKNDVGNLYPVLGKSEALYIFSGEPDYYKGYQDKLVCTTKIFGEGTFFTKQNITKLKVFSQIILVPDLDEPGIKAMNKTLKELKSLLKEKKIGYKKLPFKDSEEGKDYCEWRKSHSVEEFLKLEIKEGELTNIPPKPTKEAKSQFIIKNVNSLLAKKFAPLKWAVPKILPEGTSILAGKPKMGKSALALNIALSIVCGGKALGNIQVEKGEVLYFSLEDGERRLKDRINRILNLEESPLDISGLHYANDWPKNGLQTLEQWLKNSQNARLVIIDTLAKIRPPQRGGENIYDRDYQSVQGVKKLADAYAVPILILHHVRKGGAQDALETISGSFGLSGAVDGVIVLKRDRGKHDAALHVTGREIEEKEFALRFDFPLWTLLGNAEEFRLSEERQAIILVLRDSKQLMSPKEIQEALSQKINLTYNSIKLLLSRMARDGHIKAVKRGKYGLPDIDT